MLISILMALSSKSSVWKMVSYVLPYLKKHNFCFAACHIVDYLNSTVQYVYIPLISVQYLYIPLISVFFFGLVESPY